MPQRPPPTVPALPRLRLSGSRSWGGRAPARSAGRPVPPPGADLTRPSRTQPNAAQPAFFGHPVPRRAVGGDGGRHAFLVRDQEDFPRCREDVARTSLRPVDVETAEFVAYLYHAA